MKPLNLIGQRFGRLVVTGRIPSHRPEQPVPLWQCVCDCGSETKCTTGALRSGKTKSCSCLRKEVLAQHHSTNSPVQGLLINGTNAAGITTKKPMATNALGLRGVSRDKNGRYVAFIYYKKKRRYLGTYKTAEEAKAAYDEAWLERKEQFEAECAQNGNTWKSRDDDADLTGKRCGMLTVIERTGNGRWRCRCDCGNECLKPAKTLRFNLTTSCGCLQGKQNTEVLKDQRFGHLVAKEYVDYRTWLCVCDCGNECIVYAPKLEKGLVTSCGCVQQSSDSKA